VVGWIVGGSLGGVVGFWDPVCGVGGTGNVIHSFWGVVCFLLGGCIGGSLGLRCLVIVGGCFVRQCVWVCCDIR